MKRLKSILSILYESLSIEERENLFNARECLDQALLVANNQPFDLNKVKVWSDYESGNAKQAFLEFKNRLNNRNSV